MANVTVLVSLDAAHTTLEPHSASTAAAERVVEKVHLLEQLLLGLHADLQHDTWLGDTKCTGIATRTAIMPVRAPVEHEEHCHSTHNETLSCHIPYCSSCWWGLYELYTCGSLQILYSELLCSSRAVGLSHRRLAVPGTRDPKPDPVCSYDTPRSIHTSVERCRETPVKMQKTLPDDSAAAESRRSADYPRPW